MQDDTARHGIGGNHPSEAIDDIKSPILSLPGSAKYLGGLGMSTLYEKMNKGEFEIARLDGRTFITRKSLDAYIARNIVAPKAAATKPTTGRVPRPIKRKLMPGKQRRKRDDERRAAQ
jgi:hypothetical protein